MDRISNFIDGRFVPALSGKWLDNYRPKDGAVYGQIPDSDAEDIEAAVAAAKKAFPAWKRTSRADRAAFLNRVADLIEENFDRFAEVESQDQGKTVQLAKAMDIPRAVENFRFFAGAILHQEEKAFQTATDVLNYTIREPLGVAGLISPWNLPLYLLTWKIAPALATGNTVVAKPSEITPASAFLLCEMMLKAGLPAGVCNLVFGLGSKAGDALVGHPDVPLVSFTGGTATAAAIGARAAPFAKKLSLELGGKNPCLVFDDCDLEAAVNTIVRSSFLNQGEICLCTSRIFVQEGIFAQFQEKFVEKVKALTVGPSHDPNVFIGPLASQAHLEKVAGFVNRAKTAGFPLLCGGSKPELGAEWAKGYYYNPTVIKTQDTTPEIMQEEVFGPVVTLTPFKDYDHALAMANDTKYGLAACIWTRDLNRAHKAARDLQAGQLWVNTWLKRDLRVPFGGLKASGVGREGGHYSLDFFTEEKNVCLQLDL